MPTPLPTPEAKLTIVPPEVHLDPTKPGSATGTFYLVNLLDEVLTWELRRGASNLPRTSWEVNQNRSAIGKSQKAELHITVHSTGLDPGFSYNMSLAIDSTSESGGTISQDIQVTVVVQASVDSANTDVVIISDPGPRLGQSWNGMHILTYDPDKMRIRQDIGETLVVSLTPIETDDATTASTKVSCSTVWKDGNYVPQEYAFMYSPECDIPDVDRAGSWTVSVALDVSDDTVFFSASVSMNCPPGRYEDSRLTCQPCITGTECPEDATKCTISTLKLLEDYWRCCEDSVQVLPCSSDDACQGGTVATEYCVEGYTGPLCSVCDDSFFHSWASKSCERCADVRSHVTSLSLVLGVVGTLLLLKVMLSIVPRIIASAKVHVKVAVKLVWKFYLVTKVKGLVLVVTLQVINQYDVITSSTYDGSGIQYPRIAAAFAKGLGIFNLDFITYMPPECANEKTNFYGKLVMKTIGPLCLIMLLWAHPLLKTARGEEDAGERAAASFRLMLFLELVLPSVSTTVVETCEKFDDGRFLMVQLDLSCDHHDTLRLFWVLYAGLFALLYPIGVPLGTLFLMQRHKHEIRSVMTKAEQNYKDRFKAKPPKISELVNNTEYVAKENVNTVQALRFKFEKLDPGRQCFAVIPIIVRLGQTTLLIFLRRSAIRAMCASWVSLFAIAVQREYMPYLKDSDDVFALRAQWVVFAWISTLLFVHAGVTSFLPHWAVGCFLVALAIALFGSVLSLAYDGLREVYHRRTRQSTKVEEGGHAVLVNRLNRRVDAHGSVRPVAVSVSEGGVAQSGGGPERDPADGPAALWTGPFNDNDLGEPVEYYWHTTSSTAIYAHEHTSLIRYIELSAAAAGVLAPASSRRSPQGEDGEGEEGTYPEASWYPETEPKVDEDELYRQSCSHTEIEPELCEGELYGHATRTQYADTYPLGTMENPMQSGSWAPDEDARWGDPSVQQQGVEMRDVTHS